MINRYRGWTPSSTAYSIYGERGSTFMYIFMTRHHITHSNAGTFHELFVALTTAADTHGRCTKETAVLFLLNQYALTTVPQQPLYCQVMAFFRSGETVVGRRWP
jgi:hypothetical protein